ncbi:VOC family protein [Pseudoalteromonas 'SMAR']|uniref:VOC family protein n=1 Tax=Pseudoalteromonas 'SMAR' TaxID=3416908 RepID=UPI003AF1EAE6
MATASRPKGYHAITPYLTVQGTAKAIEFYRQAFAAELKRQLPMPDGGIVHAEIKVADSHFMLCDGCQALPQQAPATLGGTSVSLLLYVDDVDSTFQRALAAGATEVSAVCEQFYGDRAGTLQDPFGHIWTIATHQHDYSEAELIARMADLMDSEQDA